MDKLRWQLTPYRLPLHRPWRTTQSHFSHRQGWLVHLSQGEHQGYGDCAPLPEAGTETAEQAESWLQQQLPQIQGLDANEALQRLPHHTDSPAARCGLEVALLDLIARQQNLPLSKILAPNAANSIPINGMIGALDNKTANRLKSALEQGYSILKLKVGMEGVEEELKQLSDLATQLPTGIQLRLDANRAWHIDEAHKFLHGIRGLPIESLEEPLQSPDYETLQQLQSETTSALALDESLALFDLDELLKRQPVRRLILKPMAQGGLLPTLHIARQAHHSGLQSVITSVVESAVGIQACCHLAAVLNYELTEQTHGLSTCSWFSRNLGSPPLIEQGRIELINCTNPNSI